MRGRAAGLSPRMLRPLGGVSRPGPRAGPKEKEKSGTEHKPHYRPLAESSYGGRSPPPADHERAEGKGR